ADGAQRDRAFEDGRVSLSTARDPRPASGLEFLAALPEDGVPLSRTVHIIRPVRQSGIRCVACCIQAPVNGFARWTIHHISIDFEASDCRLRQDYWRESNRES